MDYDKEHEIPIEEIDISDPPAPSGHDFYLMMRDDFFGDRIDYSNCTRFDGAIYISDGVWLLTSGEFECE